MMKHNTATTIVATMAALVLATAAHAWDGQRKGFILGIGAGAGLASFKTQESYTGFGEPLTAEGERQNKFALMTDFKIGYAPSNNLSLYWSSKVAWFSKKNEFDFGGQHYEESATVTNGIGGLGASYYFKPQGPSPYVTGTFGFASWGTPFEQGSESYTSTGLALGGGYEFSKHWSLEGNLSFGNPGDGAGYSINAKAVRLTVNWLGY